MLDCNSFAVLYAISDFVTGNKHPCKHILDTYLIMFVGEISRSGIAGQRACIFLRLLMYIVKVPERLHQFVCHQQYMMFSVSSTGSKLVLSKKHKSIANLIGEFYFIFNLFSY